MTYDSVFEALDRGAKIYTMPSEPGFDVLTAVKTWMIVDEVSKAIVSKMESNPALKRADAFSMVLDGRPLNIYVCLIEDAGLEDGITWRQMWNHIKDGGQVISPMDDELDEVWNWDLWDVFEAFTTAVAEGEVEADGEVALYDQPIPSHLEVSLI